MKKTRGIVLVWFVAALCSTWQSCKKDNNEGGGGSGSGPGTMDVRMTDGPALYDKVLIDIQEVKVNVEGRGWIDLNVTRKGMYNLLDFNNGIDTLLASSQLDAGTKITEVRLVLGPNNFVVVNGIQVQMETPSAEQSGLKIKINETIAAGGRKTVWIDFNAHKSIVVKGNGGYSLKPVLRCFIHSRSASIRGDVNPDNAAYYAGAVAQWDKNDTLETYLRSDGTFKVWGLTPGMYNLVLMNKDRNVVRTYQDIDLQVGEDHNLGQINF